MQHVFVIYSCDITFKYSVTQINGGDPLCNKEVHYINIVKNMYDVKPHELTHSHTHSGNTYYANRHEDF